MTACNFYLLDVEIFPDSLMTFQINRLIDSLNWIRFTLPLYRYFITIDAIKSSLTSPNRSIIECGSQTINWWMVKFAAFDRVWPIIFISLCMEFEFPCTLALRNYLVLLTLIAWYLSDERNAYAQACINSSIFALTFSCGVVSINELNISQFSLVPISSCTGVPQFFTTLSNTSNE